MEKIWKYLISQTGNQYYPSIAVFVIKEAATGRVLSEKAFLEISENSQENTCARVFLLIKLQASGLKLY